MELDQQLKVLIVDADNYGIPIIVMEKAIAPVLKLLATQLQHEQYYVLQNLDSDWVITTIANPQSKQEKKVIYAFTTVQNAASLGKTNPDLIAAPIPVVELLFRLFSLKQVDSLVLEIDPSNPDRKIEIKRDRFLNLIQQQIEQLNRTPPYIA